MRLDLADSVQHRGVVAAPKRRPISGSEREVSCLARYMPIWRGQTTERWRRSRQEVALRDAEVARDHLAGSPRS